MQQDVSACGRHKSPWIFFVVVFILSAPIWLIGPLIDRLWPGAKPINLPASALMVVCPVSAALILVQREEGWDGAKRLLQRAFDLKRIKRKRWYLPILLLMPAIMIVQHGMANPSRVVAPGPPSPAWMVVVLSLVFFIAGLGEELGWQGYAADLLLDRWNALMASLVLGTVWAAWHIVPFLQLGTSLAEIVWHGLAMVVTRILIVWLYANTGKSVFAAAIYHAMYNVSTLVLPGYGLRYDPMVVCILAAGIATFVIFLWGGKTLAHYRFARSKKDS